MTDRHPQLGPCDLISMPKTIFFSVGEPSGDQHAARLIQELANANADFTARGFGGQAMQAAGCHVDLDLTQHAVVGLLEVLPKLRQFFRFADQAEAIFQSGQIDAVMLVDFPGFNWHIAKRAKRYGIPVYYYCPPQLWAWGGWRTAKMRRTVDHVLAVLPIEETYFSQRQIPTTFVGHPFFDAVAESRLDDATMQHLGQQQSQGKRLVAILPGSRNHEVHRNWPLMLAAIRKLHQQHPDVCFQVAGYRDAHSLWCRQQLADDDHQLPIEFFVQRTSEIIEACECAMMVSGSVSLELMSRGTPAAVLYRVGRVLSAFARQVIQVDSMTLPNLMGTRKVFPEFVSTGDPQPGIDFLADSIDALLSDPLYRRQTTDQLARLADKYARPGATANVAQWLIERLPLPQRRGISRRAA